MALGLTKAMNIPFLKYRKIYYIFSAILILGSLISLLVFGLKPGIDFTGGSIIELEFENRPPSNKIIKEKLSDLNFPQIVIQPIGERGVLLRLEQIDEETHQEILKRLENPKEQRFEAIGPVFGKELFKKTKIMIALALLAIISYIVFAFRKLSYPAKSWQFGLAALIALFHDVLIPIGLFAILGKLYNVEVNIPITAALLTVLGYSINDTVVVFDRIRENLLKRIEFTFEEIVNKSLNQTLIRSLNTSLTTLFVLFAIFLFGGETLKYFSLALIVGISCGAYSSIFIASPLLVSWLKWREKKI